MNDSRLVSIAQIKEFAKVSQNIEFRGTSRKEKYEWIGEVLSKFGYFSQKKKDKSVLKTYMMQMTGFSDAQITRLIGKKRKIGKIVADTTRRHKFARIYTPEDVGRLIDTDKAHDRLSGPATKRIFQRAYEIFGDVKFERLKNISAAHIYNLRGTRQYISWAKFFTKTKPAPVNIGKRRKPNPEGKPGYLRVDTVHQGDLDKEKGVYHINLVDEVTQWEIIGAAEKISEEYLKPILKAALSQFPFRIYGFHSDNGSEYINKVVAELLNKLLIEQTKSRSRHTNDNGLVESKNGSIIRKHMGYWHIPQRHAEAINRFYENYFNPYLNYHRPCGFATETISEKGKIKKAYDVYLTPFEALKTRLNASNFLKDGITPEKLDKIAKERSDNEFAASMQKAKVELFSAIGGSASGRKSFNQKLQFPASFAGGQAIYARLISGSSLD